MTEEGSHHIKSSQANEPFFSGCILVLFKGLVGPALVLVSGLCMIINKAELGSVWDLFFLGAVVSTVLAGLLTPQKAPASPPQRGDVPPLSQGKYAALIVGLAAALYGFAHFVAPMVFRP